ncbi:MAG: 2-oxo acid dehydrogenase subunit E2 [Bacteroidetes bacterium]|nr:2-oxo acid dehydrogenase subunit E2 [Bacteroidota bacterium]
MAEAIRLGRMTDTMEEGFVAEINVKVGDTVKVGDAVADIETDKATLPLESYYNGTILHIAVKKGDTLPLNSLVAVVGKPGENFSALLSDTGAGKQEESKAPAEQPASESKAPAQQASTSTPVQQPAATTAQVVMPEDGRVKASPLAKAIAREKGIDLSKVNGSGEEGRIVKKDLENVSATPVAAAPVAKVYTSEESYTDTKVSQMRKSIAKRLSQSKNDNPHFYLTVDVNMDKAVALRTELNNLLPAKVSFNDFVIKAVALSLRQHPAVNSSWMGDTIRRYSHIHVGMAVAVDEGLLVPVIKFADNKSISDIAAEAKGWGEKAKNKKLLPADMEGSTFTISNLGMFGIEEFTAIINEPNACILAVGAIRQTPIVVNGEIKVGNMMKLTLSSDHRAVDGAVGAKFMQTLKQMLEEPMRIFI